MTSRARRREESAEGTRCSRVLLCNRPSLCTCSTCSPRVGFCPRSSGEDRARRCPAGLKPLPLTHAGWSQHPRCLCLPGLLLVTSLPDTTARVRRGGQHSHPSLGCSLQSPERPPTPGSLPGPGEQEMTVLGSCTQSLPSSLEGAGKECSGWTGVIVGFVSCLEHPQFL